MKIVSYNIPMEVINKISESLITDVGIQYEINGAKFIHAINSINASFEGNKCRVEIICGKFIYDNVKNPIYEGTTDLITEFGIFPINFVLWIL